MIDCIVLHGFIKDMVDRWTGSLLLSPLCETCCTDRQTSYRHCSLNVYPYYNFLKKILILVL